jgi:hypothetical protein
MSLRRNIGAYLFDRLREPTTWRGLALLLTSFGVTLSPEQSDAILSAGLAIVGAIATLVPERS